LVKKRPGIAPALGETLAGLESDAFQPSLRTHKLKGRLANSWACSISPDLRIVFRFVRHESEDAILLEGVGTHEEVH